VQQVHARRRRFALLAREPGGSAARRSEPTPDRPLNLRCSPHRHQVDRLPRQSRTSRAPEPCRSRPHAAAAHEVADRQCDGNQADQLEREHRSEHVCSGLRDGHIPDTSLPDLTTFPPASVAKIWLISACRNRNRPSSSFLRRIQLVTSVLHLLGLQEGQQGTTLSTSYRPPRDMASTQSFCSGVPIAPQYAQPPHATFRASHCELVRS